MNKNILLWQFSGFALTALLGTLLHFLYDWANQSAYVAPFSSINESTFEHMKLLYFPMLIFAIIQSRCFLEYKNFWCVKLFGILTGLTLIPTLFYTYNGVFGKSPDWINITIFFIAAAVVYILEYILLKNNYLKCRHTRLGFIFICVIGILFVVFTFNPPNIPLFIDQSNK